MALALLAVGEASGSFLRGDPLVLKPAWGLQSLSERPWPQSQTTRLPHGLGSFSLSGTFPAIFQMTAVALKQNAIPQHTNSEVKQIHCLLSENTQAAEFRENNLLT